MSTLVISVEVDTDPATTDPHEVAEALVEAYREDVAHGLDGPLVTFVSAEWEA